MSERTFELCAGEPMLQTDRQSDAAQLVPHERNFRPPFGEHCVRAISRCANHTRKKSCHTCRRVRSPEETSTTHAVGQSAKVAKDFSSTETHCKGGVNRRRAREDLPNRRCVINRSTSRKERQLVRTKADGEEARVRDVLSDQQAAPVEGRIWLLSAHALSFPGFAGDFSVAIAGAEALPH